MEFNSSVCFCLLIDNLSPVPSCTIVLLDDDDDDDGDADVDVGADVVHKQQLWLMVISRCDAAAIVPSDNDDE